jgi:putative SOS response-associated peptidase YedK
MFGDWLDPEATSKDDVLGMLGAFADPVLIPRTVSDRVNSVRNNGPELIEPAADATAD